MNEITIRTVTLSECSDVCRIEKELFTDDWSLESFQECMKNEIIDFFGAFQDSKLIGYIIGRNIAGEYEILNVAVSKAHQKKGVGKMLMEHILENAQKWDCLNIYLEVRESNLPALILYKKFGFFIMGKRKKYYSNPEEDALVMVKIIDEN